MAGIRDGVGTSNSISSRSPGLSRMPAYSVMPPSLISVPRPSTTVVEKPFDVTTRTGKSTGRRSQRRVFPGFDILDNHHTLSRIAANYQGDKGALPQGIRRVGEDSTESGARTVVKLSILYNLRVKSLAKVCLAALLLLSLGIASKAERVAQLEPRGYVNDFAGVLDPQTTAQIEDLCTQVDQKAHAQIALVTIKTLEGVDVESFAVDLLKQWGIGAKSTDRGVLILYAIQDHRAHIEVGYGLEPILPDGKVGAFQREAVPLMRSEQYSQTLLLITSRVADVIATDAGVQLTNAPPPAPVRSVRQPDGGISFGGIIFIIIIVLVILFTPLRGLLFWMLFSGMFGGRGGGFGGGGASSSW